MLAARTPPTAATTACDLLTAIAGRCVELRALTAVAGPDLPPRLLARAVSDLADLLAGVERVADDVTQAGPAAPAGA